MCIKATVCLHLFLFLFRLDQYSLFSFCLPLIERVCVCVNSVFHRRFFRVKLNSIVFQMNAKSKIEQLQWICIEKNKQTDKHITSVFVKLCAALNADTIKSPAPSFNLQKERKKHKPKRDIFDFDLHIATHLILNCSSYRFYLPI